MRPLAIAGLFVAVAACGVLSTPQAVNEDAIRAAEREMGWLGVDPLDEINTHEIPQGYESEHALYDGHKPTATPFQQNQETHGVISDSHFGAAVASIEERIYLSDVIVRATLTSTANGRLSFTAQEYLKGSGPTSFTVSADTANRNARWDGSEAILFLSTPSASEGGASGQSSAAFEFADTTTFDYGAFNGAIEYTGQLRDGYTIDRANPVWLPAEDDDEGGASGASGTVSEYVEASESVSGNPLPKITLADLKARVAWVEGGEGVANYDACVRHGLEESRYYRDWEAYYGSAWSRSEAEEYEWISGEAAPKPIATTEPDTWHVHRDAAYSRYSINGEDAALFGTYRLDDDEDPSNGYRIRPAALRPLPAGEYSIGIVGYYYLYSVCNYAVPDHAHDPVVISVTAPQGTAFEALFDPNATGYSSGGGDLSPRAITANGTTSTISGLTYGDRKVVVTADQWGEVGNLEWTFIKVDGTVALNLLPADVTKDTENNTLSWSVDEAPWSDGDKLMIRVVQSNRPPKFGQDSYTFEVAENASAWTIIGTISATDPDGDLDSAQASDGTFTVYSVISGHDQSKIRMDASAGFFMVWGKLDYETTSTYTFNVQVSDGKGGTDTATVTVNVTDVAD